MIKSVKTYEQARKYITRHVIEDKITTNLFSEIMAGPYRSDIMRYLTKRVATAKANQNRSPNNFYRADGSDGCYAYHFLVIKKTTIFVQIDGVDQKPGEDFTWARCSEDFPGWVSFTKPARKGSEILISPGKLPNKNNKKIEAFLRSYQPRVEYSYEQATPSYLYFKEHLNTPNKSKKLFIQTVLVFLGASFFFGIVYMFILSGMWQVDINEVLYDRYVNEGQE